MKELAVVGAGAAGLAAAITAARAGAQVTVYERRETVGARFHDDFQGLENWTRDDDVVSELAAIGIEPTFDHSPVHEFVLFAPGGRELHTRSRSPLFYLVRRGSARGSLDVALRQQAEAHGVMIRYGSPRADLPEGGIVAHGPHRADAVAVGYVFDTDAPDGVYCAVSSALAHTGYAYLIVNGGHGTIAACLFDDFHAEATYLQRTVDFFTAKTRITMRSPRRFGGLGNIGIPKTARKGRILFAGEGAGFQDALAGFGMRSAMLSGVLAARAWLADDFAGYDLAWRQRLERLLVAGIVNRFLYERLGERAFGVLLAGIEGAQSDLGPWLRNRYAPRWWHPVVLPLALRSRLGRSVSSCVRDTCDCTWCRCHRHEDDVRTPAA